MSTETLPVRILYKGASTVMWQSHGDRRAPGLLPYPRVVEQHLRARGHDVDTRVDAMSAQRVYDLMDRWERQATSEFPDVVVLHHGHMETVHAVIPRFIERHARANRERPGPVRQRYRRVLVRPLWKGLAVLQQRVDGAMPGPLARGLARVASTPTGSPARCSGPRSSTAPSARWWPGATHLGCCTSTCGTREPPGTRAARIRAPTGRTTPRPSTDAWASCSPRGSGSGPLRSHTCAADVAAPGRRGQP